MLKKPSANVFNYLVRAPSRGRVSRTLSGTIFSNFGFNPWCKGYYGKLRRYLNQVSERRPELAPNIGIFVFGIGATKVPSLRYANSSFFTVSWSELGTSSRDRYWLYYTDDNERTWHQIHGWKSIHLKRGFFIRFAVRVISESGARSPWVRTPLYLS